MSDTPAFEVGKLQQWIDEQTALGPRRPGSPAGQAQEEALVARLSAFGFQRVRKEPISVVHWNPREAHLATIQNSMLEPIECFPIPYAAFTEKPVRARLRHANHRGWRGADWTGSIVVAEMRFPQLDARLLRRIALGEVDREATLRDVQHPATWVRLGWHFYLRAVKKGAAGFIGIVKDQPGGSCHMYAPYGFREKDILDKPVPGVWVSATHGEKLLTLARGDTQVELCTSGQNTPSLTHNIIGELGPADAEAMVLTCHHDSPFRSPVEDASGVAVVLGIAERLAKEKSLQRRLVVLFTAGHFYGSIGTRTFIEEHRAAIARNVVFALSIEHIAKEAMVNKEGALVPTGRPEAAGVFLSFNRWLREALLQVARNSGVDRWVLLPAEGPLGNYPPTDGGDWYLTGVPIVNYISNPVYLLTDDDADQWVNSEDLPRVATAFYQLLRAVDVLSRATLAKCDFPLRRGFMKVLRWVQHAKTTRFGRRPVY